ncbi:MAG: 30S ribosomal protein S10, partial [Candidatus Vogelbacteria bacterium]|nr:30S ribosomal protein S10 [Candidatus Vogelbacteria bacterium]
MPTETETKTKAKPAVKRVPKAKKDEAKELAKLRIRVSAYEHKVLDASVKQIVDTAARYDGKIEGPIPLPT